MSVGDNQTEGIVVALPPPADPMQDLEKCLACLSKIPRHELVQLRCTDKYCSTCLEKMFETAMKDETMYPPSCCGVTITTKDVQSRLPKSLIWRFKRKQPELSTRNKLYCYVPTCSTFIASHSIHNGQAICQRCRSVTCSKCRNKWHFGTCVEGEDAALFDLVRSTKWKKCPECRRVVSKNTGCNHIVCRCGTEFCYGCGVVSHNCECRPDEDDGDDDDDYHDDSVMIPDL